MAELFLGPRVDPDSLEPTDDRLTIHTDTLTRHAVCFGATGSGKTGLAIVLVEELVRAGVPVIAVDPKGDLADLSLLDQPTSEKAIAGLARSGLRPSDVEALRERIDVAVLTPGSRSVRPVDVLGSLAAPAVAADDPEGLDEAVRAVVDSLLGLVDVRVDPIVDPRHIVLSRVIRDAWAAAEALDLHAVVLRLVDPPFPKVGAFPVDTFLPRKDRMELAVRLNGLIASPAFAAWSEGDPIDPDALLEAPEGRVPVRIFYLAHLDEAERQLAAGLLLSQLAGWVRQQPGSNDLRAVVLFDEAWGYAPPHPASPPTKRPLLQLLKQARAVGLGVVLVSQNPVDLDYKVLSNAGTWFVGRLATEQDRERVTKESPEVRERIDRLPPWTFWVRRPGTAEDTWLTTRFAMTPLPGPLTLRQLEERAVPTRPAPAPAASAPPSQGWLPAAPSAPLSVRFLDPGVARSPRLSGVVGSRNRPASDAVHWEPALLARLDLRFDERGWSAEREELRLVFPLDGRPIEPELEPGDLLDAGEGRFAPLGTDLSTAALKPYARTVIDDVLAGETERRFRHRDTGLSSHAGETRQHFIGRLEASLTDGADSEVRKLRDRVEKDVERLEKKRKKIVADIDRYETEAQAKLATEVVHAGEALFGLFFGGRRKSLSSVASRREQSRKAGAKVDRLETEVTDLERELYEAEIALQDDIERLHAEHLRGVKDLEEQQVGLERDDISIRSWELVWIPVSDPI